MNPLNLQKFNILRRRGLDKTPRGGFYRAFDYFEPHPERNCFAWEELPDCHLIGLHVCCAFFSRGDRHQLVENFLTRNLTFENNGAAELSNPNSIDIRDFWIAGQG